jgi:GT2 family glycosyltransferase
MLEFRVIDVVDGRPARWHVMALSDGSPVASFFTPALEPHVSSELREAVLARRADPEIARRALVSELRERLDPSAAPVAPPHRTRSVVVCTHRRPQQLPSLLAGLAELDPAPDEIVVVDNDPGKLNCRSDAHAIGARYVREDRRGLNNARNAGLRASRHEVIVFTDDDCRVPKSWLAPLDAAFACPGVVAVTGPAFPFRLDAPAASLMEEHASLARGLRRMVFDWSKLDPSRAGVIGVGANMAFRRDALLALGSPVFAPELDAGTATESGGDTYVFAELLASGARIMYEPDMYLFHEHRADSATLHRAVRGYGVGLSAALTKLLVDDREPSVFWAWSWLVTQCVRSFGMRAMGRADARSTGLAWSYLCGGFIGPIRWWRTRTRRRVITAPAAPSGRPVVLADAVLHSTTAGSRARLSGNPAVSVIVPTIAKRRDVLARCLRALADQESTVPFEVLVVEDAARPSFTAVDTPPGLRLRILASGGHGPAAARNLGAAEASAPLLLFLDDDMVADPHLVETHIARHQAPGARVVVGAYPARPVRRTLVAIDAARWWADFFDGLDQAIAHSFTSALTGNLSVRAETFAVIGGFDERFGSQRREDWEWGLRVRGAEVPIEFEPEAVAHHEYSLDSGGRLDAARREGYGDWLIVQSAPEAVAALPLGRLRSPSRLEPLRKTMIGLADSGPARGVLLVLLNLLESIRLRRLWSRLFQWTQAIAYWRGLRSAGFTRAQVPSPAVLQLPLESAEPIIPPLRTPPLLQLTLNGRELSRVYPADGLWTPGVADQVADAIPWPALRDLAAVRGWLPRSAPPRRLDGLVEVLLPAGNPILPSLEQAATRITVIGSSQTLSDAWSAAAALPGPPLLAFLLRGVCADREWLDECLVAFDSERVGLVWGGALGGSEPLSAVHLHDECSLGRPPSPGSTPPCYVIVRRSQAATMASDLAHIADPVAAILRAATLAPRIGLLSAHHDTHGLTGQLPETNAAVAAWTQLRLCELFGGWSGTSTGLARIQVAKEAAATLLWESVKASVGNAASRQLLTHVLYTAFRFAKRGRG